MTGWLKQLDGLLRGERTGRAQLSGGRLELPLRVFVPVAIILGALYGFFMGWFAIARSASSEQARDGWMQMLASAIKIPALFLCTLIVTFPSLYVFNALVGCRLSFLTTLRLLVAAIVINLAVAASLGPIVAFFTLSTDSYHFMQLLNVTMLGIAGFIGLGFLLKTLRRYADAMGEGQAPVMPPELAQATPDDPDLFARAQAFARDQRRWLSENDARGTNGVFYVWVFIYGLVGAQMGWLLRPFIGHPGLAFEWFRDREGNVFATILHSLGKVLGL